jgi:hypothetical protein
VMTVPERLGWTGGFGRGAPGFESRFAPGRRPEDLPG